MSSTAPVLAALTALALVLALATSASADLGTLGAGYGTASAPTGEKPQSKLWFNDGTWWAVMYNAATTDFEIYKRAGNTWQTTGTKIDVRVRAWPDVVWDGAHLQVVSAGTSVNDTGAAVRYSRFGYDSATNRYVTEIAPKALTNYGVETAVIDRDSTGKVWVTFTHGAKVYVAHTTTDQSTWTSPFVIPVSTASTVSADDISAIVAFNGHIGVMYSDQTSDGSPDAFVWATHADGDADDTWQSSTAMSGVEMADDHINLKAIDGDPAGQVFAAVKTSLNRSTDPQIMLLALDNAGAWHQYPVLRVSDGTPTRAQVAIDRGRRELYVFAAEGPCCNGGAIYVKKTSLDALAFATGKGTAVIQSSSDTKINNVNTPKQPVDATTNLPILAGDDGTHRYWHTVIPLDGADITPPETTLTGGPTGTTAATTAQLSFTANETGATFECSVDGATFRACTSPVIVSDLAPGRHGFRAFARDAAGNVDATPVLRTWTVADSPSLFLDDFESGGFSQWTTLLTGADGTAAVQDASVGAGTFAARLSATTATGSFAYARETLSAPATSLTAAGTFRIDGEGAVGGNVPLLRLYDPTGVRVLTMYRPNGSTKIYVGHSGTNYETRGRLPAATFSRFEADLVTAGAGASTLVVRQDGTEVYRTTTASLGTAGIATLQIGNDTRRQPFVLVADDVEVR